MHEDDDILVEKINGMWSVANDVSGSDALVRIIIGKDDAGVNKMTDVSLRHTNNETTILKLFLCTSTVGSKFSKGSQVRRSTRGILRLGDSNTKTKHHIFSTAIVC